MKLISNFTDYYEASGLAFGVDNKLVYERKTTKVDSGILTYQEIKQLTDYAQLMPRSGYFTGFNVHKKLIGFCGKLYPAWKLFYTSEQGHNTLVFTKSNQLINYFEANKLTKWLDNFTEPKKGKWRRGYALPLKQWAIDYWTNNYLGINVNQDIFYKLNSPVFKCSVSHLDIHNLVINPNLKELSFQHVLDPFTAFQEISMYLGSINSQGENRDYSVGSDKIIAEQKGFGSKSFTQIAPTKKAKRKLNKLKKTQ